MTRDELEQLVRQVLREQLQGPQVVSLDLPQVTVSEKDRLDTGNPQHRVWTKDVLTLAQSPRLGAGIMVMERTSFPWRLDYLSLIHI